MVKLIETVYNFLWGDLLTAPLPGGGTLPLSLLVILLIPTGVYFTIRTKFLPIRLFKDMVGALFEKKDEEQSALSVIQTLIVSTATRVGMGNLVGVVAAISAGGAGAVRLRAQVVPRTGLHRPAVPLDAGGVPLPAPLCHPRLQAAVAGAAGRGVRLLRVFGLPPKRGGLCRAVDRHADFGQALWRAETPRRLGAAG